MITPIAFTASAFRRIVNFTPTKPNPMKNLITLFGVTLLLVSSSLAQTSGGPDAFGYTWKDSNDPNGPNYSWLNIQDVGVQVTGLTDDNATTVIPMGMDFHFYWYDVNQLVIGSNGWVSFDQVSNIAHCFPTIPSPGGASDNYLAPFMTDLIMNASGTNASVYYWHDSSNDRFVISYLDVPWWQQAAPGYVGENTFQIILSNQDSSITFQYKDLGQAALLDNVGCDADLIIGMENITGNIGLGLGQFTEVVPNDLYAVKFYAPVVALISIPDITPLWNENSDNKAVFIQSNLDYNISSTVKNVGNADVTTAITVSTELENLALVTAYTSTDNLSGLAAGASSAVNYTQPVNLSPGQYYFNVQTSNGSDINPGNNTRVTEINSVDVTAPDVVLSYASQNLPDGNVGWTGGGGMAIYVEPPVYPATLTSVDIFVTSGLNGADAFTVQALDTDGPNGLPGTILAQVDVAALSYTPDAWVNVPLPLAETVSAGGVYLGFIHTADGVFLGTETAAAGPISRRSYEFVGGSWAAYRENTNVDLLINGHFSFLSVGVEEANSKEGFKIYPNPNNGVFFIEADLDEATIRVFDALGKEISATVTKANNGASISIEAKPGSYLVQIVNSSSVRTERITLF